MRKIFLFLLLLVSIPVFSQSKKYVKPPVNVFDYTLKKAITAWIINWQLSTKDTLTWVYIGQSVYWRYMITDSLGNILDSLDYKFSIDSIRGRGDTRQAMIHRSYKTPIDSEWAFWWKDTGMTFTKIRPSTDSSAHYLKWTMPTPPDGIQVLWEGKPATVYPADVWLMGFKYNQLTLTFDKVIGDPTVNQGTLQRVGLRFKYKPKVPDSLLILTH